MTRTRGQNEGTIYRRQDGRWTGVVSLGYRNGKRQRKHVYGRIRREVQEKLTQVLRDHQRGLPVPVGQCTVGQFLERWLEDAVRNSVRPLTFTSYRQLVRGHITPALGKVVLSKLTPQQVQAFMNAKLSDGFSPRTVQYLRAVLRRALNQALRWDLVVRNVATLVDPPHVPRAEIKPLTPTELGIFLDAVRGQRFEALYVLAIATGLRRGELLGLKWLDLDLDKATLRVRRALQRLEGGLQFVEPKSANSRRTLTLPLLAVEALRERRRRQLEERLAAGSRWVENGLVFTTRKGTPLDHATVVRDFHRSLKSAGLRHQRPHDLRHANATLMLSEGVHPRVVMEMLGHSSIALTLDTYSHVIPTLQSDAASRVDAVLRRKAK